MPLRCIDCTGRSIHSFDLSDEEWQILVRKNRSARHLRMPCCASQVVLKKSARGSLFFAHKADGSCATAPETESHIRLKRMAVNLARANGWEADTEVSGATPSGEMWKADVLAHKGSHKVALEIQWSGQTNDETLRRQERYRESQVRGLWLLRQPGFPISHDLPAVCIGGSVDEGFTALIPHNSHKVARDRRDPSLWGQALPMDDFLNAVFTRRFRFGLPPNIGAKVSIFGAEMMCWSCGAETRVVTRIEIKAEPYTCYFSLEKFGKYPALIPIVLSQIPKKFDTRTIKFRFSNTVGEQYLSNGCVHCNALIGAHFVFGENIGAREWHSFPIRITEAWQNAIEENSTAIWYVFSSTAFLDASDTILQV